MKTSKYLLLLSVFVGVLLSGCQSLDVKNENDPDFAKVFSKPSDVKGVASSLFYTWFQYTQEFDGPALMLHVAADAGTCSWGNADMRYFSNEPRRTFDNTPAYSNAVVNENYYEGLYGNLSSCNDVLGIINKGMVIEVTEGLDETAMVKAVAYLAQGLTLGYLGLVYDQSFIVTEHTNLMEAIPLSPYADVIDTALVSIDRCIALCESETFEIPDGWFPGLTMTNVELGQFANTVAAILMSYSPRNSTQNAAVDWAKVLTYANKGLTYDFIIYTNGVNWYSNYQYNAARSGWVQADMRIVNMMDSRFPSRWTDAGTWGTLPVPVTTHTAGIDDRIFTDFNYLSTCGFRVERGYYHFSSYRQSRHDAYVANGADGNVPLFYKAENDLLKAEAMMYTGNLTGAANIINTGTRVTRGGLPAIGATIADVNNAIFYERNIELFCTGMGLEFFVMRKADKLQEGTPLHLPIPGAQLEVNQMDYYTFGGAGTTRVGEAGVDVSSGGWF